jgi:hypothetical protein
MAISNFGELKSVIADFLQRDDLTLQIPMFVELATARFSDELRAPEMETVALTTLTGEWTALPVDFRAIRLMEANGKVLEYRTPWQTQKLVEVAAIPGVPVYTIQDMQFRVYPFPTSTSVELTYYAAIAPLANDSDSNWLLAKRPDVYLYASLAHARMYLHDDARIAVAQAFTDKYIVEANRASRQIAIGSSPLAVRAG